MMHRIDVHHYYRQQYYKTANRHHHAETNYGYKTTANRDYVRVAANETTAEANSDNNGVLALHTSLICFKVALCFLLP